MKWQDTQGSPSLICEASPAYPGEKRVGRGSGRIENPREISLQETAGLSAVPEASGHHLCFASSLLELFLALGERDSFFLPLTSNAVLESNEADGQSGESHRQHF